MNTEQVSELIEIVRKHGYNISALQELFIKTTIFNNKELSGAIDEWAKKHYGKKE